MRSCTGCVDNSSPFERYFCAFLAGWPADARPQAATIQHVTSRPTFGIPLKEIVRRVYTALLPSPWPFIVAACGGNRVRTVVLCSVSAERGMKQLLERRLTPGYGSP